MLEILKRSTTSANGELRSEQKPDIPVNVSPRVSRGRSHRLLFVLALLFASRVSTAQEPRMPASRWRAYGLNVARVSAGALGWAAWDQLRDDPEEWGTGWRGYERRAVSEIAGSVVQETITEGLAAAMRRPLDFRRCVCHGTGRRFTWAVRGALFDQMPDGSTPLAVPRIVGAYGGAFARTTWHPAGDHSRAAATLISGSSSLAVGALINLAYEFVIR